MTDFVFELLTEEIPARMQAAAAEQLRVRFGDGIAGRVPVGDIAVHVTPRRLVLYAQGLGAVGNVVREERRGPRVDAPAAAIDGFLRSTGLARAQLAERVTPKGTFLYAVVEAGGRPTPELLAELLPQIVRAFDWPKSMRWGAASARRDALRWVRPLQGIVALFGDAVVPFDIDGLASGRVTHGHRFMAPGAIAITDAASYAGQLRAAHVVLDPAERRSIIASGAAAAAAAHGLRLVDDAGLTAENAGLTEWPVPLLGHFDPAFLQVPREIIQLTMRTNQKYFACVDADGALAPAFVCVANIAAADGGASIVAGNRKVLAARLADAKFFWDADLKAGLDGFTPKLGTIVFHEKLGTIADKVERVAKLARWLVESGAVGNCLPSPSGEGPGVGSHDRAPTTLDRQPHPPTPSPEGEGERLAALATRAARLCKADLTTATVGEFPEVQGIAGRYLALASGEDPAVADAIRDHYKPVGQGDDVPTAPVSVALALADKLDTLVQFFSAHMPPTGSKDPYALRRAGLGVISLLVTSTIRLRLFGALSQVHSLLTGSVGVIVADEITQFLIDRLKVQQREAGVRHDLIDAVFALGGEDDLVRLLARVHALQAFLRTADGVNLFAGYKRAANILRIEGVEGGGAVYAALLDAPAERALAAALDAALPDAQAAVAREDFAGAMTALSGLRAAVDAFFETVIVNAPEPALRSNRLNLLARFRNAVHEVADFSAIEG